ncbi:hypothetical protein Agub_g9437, partial [Astrephomene gubernaculifera]
MGVTELWKWGRRASVGASPHGRSCTCHAKRYVPAKKQRQPPAGGTFRAGGKMRKQHAAEHVADADELLQELNSGGVGWLQNEDEQDWGLDDVAVHARTRQQHEQQRLGCISVAAAPSADATGAPGGRRRGPSVADPMTHGSPLATGLARVLPSVVQGSPAPHASNAGSANSRLTGGSDSNNDGGVVEQGRQHAGLGGVGNGKVPAGEATAAARVEVDVSYARRNPEVVEALRRQGISVHVSQPDEEDNGDEEEEEEEDARAGRASLDEDEDEDDALGLDLESDLGFGSDEDDVKQPSSRAGGGGGNRGGGGSDWYGSLAAAGFNIRTNASGEVFLERTVRRKTSSQAATAAPAASAAGSAATTSTNPPPSQPAAVRRTTAKSATTAAAALVPPLAPLTGRPAVAAALRGLREPQQVLDFLDLSYPQWAANGYRLVDMRSGGTVPAPSPAEAAHCLRALALTARRTNIGGWRCLDLAAGRQVQGLAECLRATPPRLLPEHNTPQRSAAHFEAARRYWLAEQGPAEAGGSSGGDPRVGSSGGKGRGGGGDAASVGAKDATYDKLLAKYTALSQQSQEQQRQQGEQQQQQEGPNGAAAASQSAAATTQTTSSPKPSPSAAAAAADVTTQAPPSAARCRTAKIECLVAALWGLSSLGGSPYFTAETEALLAILVRCLQQQQQQQQQQQSAATSTAGAAAAARTAGVAAGSGRSSIRGGGLSGWQAGQVLWALGNSRHASPRLRDLEAILIRSGGLASMCPRDASRVLWGFASLGYRPERLLGTIMPDWGYGNSNSSSSGSGSGSDSRRGAGRGELEAWGIGVRAGRG